MFSKAIKKILFPVFITSLALVVLTFAYFEHKEIPIYNLKVAAKFILGKPNYTPYKGLIERLGYSENDKLLIIQADDIGLAKSVNKASFEALKKGYVSSGSVMATCGYVNEVGEFAVNNPNIDLGIHLTVTSEWRDYRWGGILPALSTPSMVNKKGELKKSKKKFVLSAEPLELKKELQAQIDLTKSIGIRPTHIDSHEGALFFNQDLFRVYLEVGEENKLPVFVPKMVATHFSEKFPKPENVIVIENFYMAQKGLKTDDWESFYINTLNGLKPGISTLIVHLGFDDDEMRLITVGHPDYGAKWRELDYRSVSSKKFEKALKRNNIKLITWKEIQKVLY